MPELDKDECWRIYEVHCNEWGTFYKRKLKVQAEYSELKKHVIDFSNSLKLQLIVSQVLRLEEKLKIATSLVQLEDIEAFVNFYASYLSDQIGQTDKLKIHSRASLNKFMKGHIDTFS